MKIRLVSHASLLVEVHGVRILTDPWYEGTICSNGWALCPEPPVLPDYRTLDALFISHAGPDHFDPRTLARIMEVRGRGLPVFIPRFLSGAMARELRAIGFCRVTEMAPGDELTPFPRVRLFSQQFGVDHSVMVIRGERDETLVNLNDAPVRGAVLRNLADRYPYVTYLAAGLGVSPSRLDAFARVLHPRFTIPFAGFVRFCHSDNAYLNAHRTTPAALARETTTPLTILYPGDAIEGGELQADGEHRERFEAAHADRAVITEWPTVSHSELDHVMARFERRLAERMPRVLRNRLPAVALIVTDASHGYMLERGRVLTSHPAPLERMPVRYRLASEVLRDCVRDDGGWTVLTSGARTRAEVEPGWERAEGRFRQALRLAANGYLDLRPPRLLGPRALGVWRGRRLELWDQLRPLLTGSATPQPAGKEPRVRHGVPVAAVRSQS